MIYIFFFLVILAATIFFIFFAWHRSKKDKTPLSTKVNPPTSSGLGNLNQHSPLNYLTEADHPIDQILPNGYTRDEYHSFGISDFEIEFWGLDQPGAPPPGMAGLVIMDIWDGDLDGNIDI